LIETVDRAKSRQTNQLISSTAAEAGDQENLQLKKASDELRGAAMNLTYWAIGKMQIERKSDKKYQAMERIRQCRDNSNREGRGKSIFVMSRPTFAGIIRAVRNSAGYSKRETARILLEMYIHGRSFNQTKPKVSRRTAHRYLISAFRNLQTFTGYGMEPSLATLRASHNLMRDAKLLGRDLSTDFLIV